MIKATLTQKLNAAGLGCLVVLASITVGTQQADAAVVTFNETIQTGTGFNGINNPFRITSDSQFRVEAFWLNTSGHFHTNNISGNNLEINHNYNGGSRPSTQGIRITRVDSGLFDLVSMGLFGQAAVGNFDNFTTGAGLFSLFTNNTGSSSNPGTISFGSQFTNLASIVLADPGAAGGSSSSNSWDNINVQASSPSQPVPEPLTILGSGLALGFGSLMKRQHSRKLKKTGVAE